MTLPRGRTAALWLLATAAALCIGDAWADDAQAGKVQPWVLIALFWGAALLSVSVHYMLRYLAPAAVRMRRFWQRQAPQLPALMAAAYALTGQGRSAIQRTLEQPAAGMLRVPSALIGWSRSALRSLRA